MNYCVLNYPSWRCDAWCNNIGNWSHIQCTVKWRWAAQATKLKATCIGNHCRWRSTWRTATTLVLRPAEWRSSSWKRISKIAVCTRWSPDTEEKQHKWWTLTRRSWWHSMLCGTSRSKTYLVRGTNTRRNWPINTTTNSKSLDTTWRSSSLWRLRSLRNA